MRTCAPCVALRSAAPLLRPALLFIPLACNSATPEIEPRRDTVTTQAAQRSIPLRLHPTNHRYFVDGFGRTVYLTGSHTWNQCGDGFDYEAYLDFLQKYHHNFIRLWSGDYGISGSPPAYLRPGPRKALDGGPKVDLSQPNPAYFDRVRSCSEAARKRGIYVAISFFPIDSAKRQSDRDESPYFAPNNLQELGADADGNGHLSEAFDLSIPELTAYQEAFARKLIDAVNDLDNVLYEIGNEGDVRSAAWQYHLVRIIREHEFRKPKQHLVGITAMLDWPTHTDGSNEVLLASPADWVSLSGVSYRADVPASDGTKASILDTDHISVVKPDWVWKCFTRGHHPILMDWYGHESLPMNWYTADEQEVMRNYLGYTLQFAQKMALGEMRPADALSSTQYCLAHPGHEYLVYQPAPSSAFTVELIPGAYTYEWFNPASGTTPSAGSLTAEKTTMTFVAPFAGEAILYLRRLSEPGAQPR